MRKILIVCSALLLFGAGNAMAQNYAVAIDGSQPFSSEATIKVGSQITFDIYLEDAPGQATAGGVWVDFSGSTDKIAYVSAGRALTDSSEGISGPWHPAAGQVVNEPLGVGSIRIAVGQLVDGGASLDGDGDIIVARVTLECITSGDAHIAITTILDPGYVTWGPVANGWNDDAIDATTAEPALVIHQSIDIGAVAIPTLGEWGMIIFMTIILGIGVVTLVRRKTMM